MNALTLCSTAIRQLDVLYSLNDLHVAPGADRKHQPSNFMRLDTTVALIEEIRSSDLRNEPFRTIQGGKAQSQGTYVCKELVYAYAMWISAKFHLAVIRAFDALQTPTAPQAIPLMLPGDAKAQAGKRYLVTFGGDGQTYAAWPLEPDCCVMTPDQFVKNLHEFPLDADTLTALITACAQRLRSRLPFVRAVETAG